MKSILRKAQYWITHPSYAANRAILASGYDYGQWSRVVMDQEIFGMLASLPTANMRAMEISPNPTGSRWAAANFESFKDVHYPEFDICCDQLDDKFDIIIADQVFEHLKYPYRAAKNIYEMLAPGGFFLNTTPFLIRHHANPDDYSRWTELGMTYFLEESGFSAEQTQTGSWGNRKCVVANLHKTRWASFGWGKPINNEPEFPVVVWALAQKES
tara:strand:+ start:4985 stop:5626 length:642 start_codon:yes stop_codon:yes gene_type:complete